VNLLPDTHVVLWWLGDDPALGAAAREALADPDNTVYLSAVVVWEARIKQAVGKLDLPEDFEEVLDRESFVDLPVTARHAHALARLPMHHRDPFDRMLIAQAHCEDLHLVTTDPAMGRYDVSVLTR
jgi:PIN domain nuclease of toxin-antitoxin system